MEYIQWHPAFVASLKVGCSKERMKVEVESEHNLSKKPMQIIVTSELSETKNFWLKYLRR